MRQLLGTLFAIVVLFLGNYICVVQDKLLFDTNSLFIVFVHLDFNFSKHSFICLVFKIPHIDVILLSLCVVIVPRGGSIHSFIPEHFQFLSLNMVK